MSLITIPFYSPTYVGQPGPSCCWAPWLPQRRVDPRALRSALRVYRSDAGQCLHRVCTGQAARQLLRSEAPRPRMSTGGWSSVRLWGVSVALLSRAAS